MASLSRSRPRPDRFRVPRAAFVRRLGRAINRAAKRRFRRALARMWPVRPQPPIDAAAVRRVLLVRVNFRVGNTVLATARLAALRACFPAARIDFLAAEPTACLLEGLDLGCIHRVSRRHAIAPWSFLALVARLRRERYDVAVDGGMTSFSGALYACLSGARHRLGAAGPTSPLLTTSLPIVRRPNVYDRAAELARALEVEAETTPVYRVSAAEEEAALATLADLDLAGGGESIPFAAAFAGGYREKRWPRRAWLDLVERLEAEDVPAIVFVGPEEAGDFPALRAWARASVRVLPPQALRAFAALLARASVLVTTDSGPMHLGAALGVPVIALVQTERSLDFVPPGDRLLFRPSPDAVMAALRDHPTWPRTTGPLADWAAPLRRSGTAARR